MTDSRMLCSNRNFRGAGPRIDKAAVGSFSDPIDGLSYRERTGNAVRNASSQAAAAPATVSGEPEPQSHWVNPGKAVTGNDPRARRPAVDTIVGPGGVPRTRSIASGTQAELCARAGSARSVAGGLDRTDRDKSQKRSGYRTVRR